MTVTATRQGDLHRAAARGRAVGAAAAPSGPVVAPGRAGAATEQRVPWNAMQAEHPSISAQSTGTADVADAVT
jgi:hypothetical protein